MGEMNGSLHKMNSMLTFSPHQRMDSINNYKSQASDIMDQSLSQSQNMSGNVSLEDKLMTLIYQRKALTKEKENKPEVTKKTVKK